MATFTMYEESPVIDSMCYDSQTHICSYTDGNYTVNVFVDGEVKVFYKDNAYKYYTDMPEELQEKFKTGKMDDIEVWNNNWFEIEFLKDNDFIDSQLFDIGTPVTADELKDLCAEAMEIFKKENKLQEGV